MAPVFECPRDAQVELPPVPLKCFLHSIVVTAVTPIRFGSLRGENEALPCGLIE